MLLLVDLKNSKKTHGTCIKIKLVKAVSEYNLEIQKSSQYVCVITISIGTELIKTFNRH